jgi:hypothetical protein
VNRIRKWWKAALGVAVAAVVLQVAASLVVRTGRVRLFLTRQLETAFGRKVEVGEYSATLFPTPQLDAKAITVGEDPSFGQEYFLRAERLSAGLRWLGLLHGRFELGTLDLERPSLILVRNSEGRWNLERWLPAPSLAMQAKVAGAPARGTQAAPTHLLRKIEITDGRVNFKVGDEKSAFAFVQVEGSVEQMAPGRWRLDLAAGPWRSGATLQLAGTVRVSGEVAGTSTRLQPAHLKMSWEKSSLADVFRLVAGRDFGVRGTFAGEATADSGTGLPAAPGKNLAPGDWIFSLQTRASGIHRWDLTERSDNPRIGLKMSGRWNPGASTTDADELIIEMPRSNLRGTASSKGVFSKNFQVRIDSAGLQAADFLDWYRAFQPDVAEEVRASQYFTGAVALSGWPLKLDEAAFSSTSGRWMVPGFAAPLEVKALRGGTQRGRFVVEPFAISLPATGTVALAAKEAAGSAKPTATLSHGVTLSLAHDLQQRAGAVRVETQSVRAETILALAEAFGKNLRHGWEVRGEASGDLRWEWSPGAAPALNGQVDLTRGTLQVAGLNQPVQLENLRAEWRQARRRYTLGKVGAFGATWSGSIEQTGTIPGGSGERELPVWGFQLQTDHLDAAELDRWIGPRSRPNWLQRLLPAPVAVGAPLPSSSLLKRIHADGELKAEEIAIEKIMLKQFRGQVSVDGTELKLQKIQAQWSGGTAQGSMNASLSASPSYEVAASLNGVSLVLTPWLARLSEHLAGTASGTLKLRARGVGRDALLKSLAGEGEIHLSKVELRGWDVAGTMAQGQWKTGVSRWATGSGTFHLSDGGFELNGLKLASASDEFLLKGSVSFSQDADLTAESHFTGHGAHAEASARFLTISGPLSEPKVSLEKATAQQPGD